MKWLKLSLALLFFTVASAHAGNFGKPISTTVRVSFADSSTKFHPLPEDQTSLADAKNAAVIYVSGRTSTKKPSSADEALAFKRAAAARAYLIEQGISPLKIMVNYVSAADYVADNDTPWGRLANQRVDIEMIFVPAF